MGPSKAESLSDMKPNVSQIFGWKAVEALHQLTVAVVSSMLSVTTIATSNINIVNTSEGNWVLIKGI